MRFVIPLILVLLAARSVAADEPVQSASQLFEQGLELIEQGKYEEAAIAFRTAYELAPNYKVLYNVGEAERLVGHHAKALEAYMRYLEEGGDQIEPDRAEYVRETIDDLRWKVGAVQVECPVDGAVVLIDDRPRGHTPLPGSISVDAGSHSVAIVDDGFELHREIVEVVGEEVSLVVVEIEPEPVSEPLPPPSATAEATAGSPLTESGEPATEPDDERVWTWVVLGTAAATGVAAAVTGNLALAQAREIDSQCEGNICPYELHDEGARARALALTADLLLGATAALAITGTILYFVEPTSAAGERAAGPSLTVVAGSGLVVEGRF
jgi:tetratricopeptide (TPR) repeat protein